MALKNTALTVVFTAWDVSGAAAVRKTGDAANLTASISKDGAAYVAATNAPVEIGTTGTYKLVLTAAETNCGSVACLITSSTASVLCDPVFFPTETILHEQVPGSFAAGSIAERIGRIGTAGAIVTTPVSTDGEISIVRGDDYNSLDSGRAINIVYSNYPDLTGATITAKIQRVTGGAVLATIACAGVSVGGASQTVNIPVTSAISSALPVTSSVDNVHMVYDVEAVLSNGRTISLTAREKFIVLADVR